MKKIITVILALIIFSAACISAVAAVVFRYGDWTLSSYRADDGSDFFAVSSYEGVDTELVIPDNYGGYPVTAIEDYAFLVCDQVKKIHIPDSVTKIGDDAFYGLDDVVIVAPDGSFALSFAEDNGIAYRKLYSYLRGDANGDGEIDITDATIIQRVLAEIIEDDGMISIRGDVDGDGLNILDATLIQRYLVNLYIPYSINETVETEI